MQSESQYFYVAACPVDHREELELLDDYLRGTLRYEPNAGGGTIFRFTLPSAKAGRWW